MAALDARPPLLETIGLSRSFGGLKAVSEVDFRLARGEVRAVIGPNGAGKTTFVSLISGRIVPSAGRVLFEGEDVTALPAFRRVRLGIAYTFQITSIYANLSAEENVALAAHQPGRKGSIAQLERVGLADRAAQVAGTLSYGHQRLLEVAMGLALRPKLLILDEPTQGLSDAEIEGFIALVREVARDATVLLIEHNMPVVMELAHRITVLDRGSILAEGSPAEIRADPRVQSAYLGTG
jgi:branched-chain amino acid transport system ATP-binding protein